LILGSLLFVGSHSMFLAPVFSLLSKSFTEGHWVRQIAVAGLVGISLCTNTFAQVNASTLSEINQLLEQGKANDAAKLVQSQLRLHSMDVQLRFMQGVVAVEQKKYDQAIQIFSALTKEHPNLPEPYNNLAVLHAIKGDDRKAAQVLEQAIGTNPSYATAHENLGDLYARMASDAYAKALQLDNSRQAIQPKLSLIRQIFPVGNAVRAAASSAGATDVPVAITRTNPSKSELAAEVPASPQLLHTSPVAKPVVQHPEPAQPTAKATPSPEQLANQEVEKAVMAWARAWAQQDMSSYYAAYSARFAVPEGNLAAWKAERRERIVGKPSITVEVRDLKITSKADSATASFRQYYASGSYKATTRKTLRLQHEGDKWRITREETGR
jgi:colicin import membrane protein